MDDTTIARTAQWQWLGRGDLRSRWAVVVAVVGCLSATGCSKSQADTCTIDNRGGLVMELALTGDSSAETLAAARDAVAKRASAFKLPCPAQVESTDKGTVELRFIGLRDTTAWHAERSLLLEPGRLSLSALPAKGSDAKVDEFVVDRLESVELEARGKSSALTMTIADAQREALASFTTTHLGKQITVIRDGALITTAKLAEPISDGRMELTVARLKGELEPLARRLRQPALPVAVRPTSVRWLAPGP